MAPTVFGHAEYRVGAEKSRDLSFGEAQEALGPQWHSTQSQILILKKYGQDLQGV